MLELKLFAAMQVPYVSTFGLPNLNHSYLARPLMKSR